MAVYQPTVDRWTHWWACPIEDNRPMVTLNPRLPLRTRDGRPAFWAHTPWGFDPREEWAVWAAINHPKNNPREFLADGRFYLSGGPHPSDLFNVPLRTWLTFRDIAHRYRLQQLNGGKRG